jgi:rhamnogalacturonan hydrolase
MIGQNCVKSNPGSTLYVPAGNYNMQTWVTLNGASKWAFRLDGFITRTGQSDYHGRAFNLAYRFTTPATTGGHMVIIENANDVEVYSANSAGGFQGNGYQCRNAGYAPSPAPCICLTYSRLW